MKILLFIAICVSFFCLITSRLSTRKAKRIGLSTGFENHHTTTIPLDRAPTRLLDQLTTRRGGRRVRVSTVLDINDARDIGANHNAGTRRAGIAGDVYRSHVRVNYDEVVRRPGGRYRIRHRRGYIWYGVNRAGAINHFEA